MNFKMKTTQQLHHRRDQFIKKNPGNSTSQKFINVEQMKIK